MESNISPKMNFTLIFKPLQSVHLHKDVGQVPFQLHKHFGFESNIVYNNKTDHFDYIESELHGLNIIKSNTWIYLIKNARKIDSLMVFHVSTQSIYAILLYKFLNPNGFAYLKADIGDSELAYAKWGNRNHLTQLKRSILFRSLLRKLDLLSIECREVFEKITQVPSGKKIHMPNGFDPEMAVHYGVKPRPFDQKENIILLVGRHGARQKNSELMLRAMELMEDLGNWRVLFIGPMTNEFRRLKDDFLETHPRLKGHAEFLGNISNKSELFGFYSRAKIFCLPSRWESWGLVCGEALSFGNVLVMSKEIVSAPDLTDDGRAGFMIEGENPKAWADTLSTLMGDQDRLADFSQRASAHFNRNFIWKNLLHDLADRIRHT
ncbi:glycosyltransferase family 4 protein [Holophaga foetida]|uniref:glycosyltransferase family 4 protein n=1 Tax=Holophaga foetida TaxID=35839 RepID=UPI0002472151|nr:glycosyltransferase family 4 protein [Holophaga foetida]